MNHSHTGGQPDRGFITADLERLCVVFLGIAGFVFAGVIAYAIATSAGYKAPFLIIGAAMLIVGFHGLAGGVLGFLFAIPRSRQQDVLNLVQKKSEEGKEGDRKVLSDYAANTNLEQISDWLTKILVGAGLVQLNAIGAQFGELATLLAPALGDGAASRQIVLCLIGFALCWGFAFSYLLIRLWLPKALSRAEGDEEIQKIEREREAGRQKFELERETELRSLERRAYDFLYEKPPGGYSRAIDAIEAYNAKTGTLQSGWLNLYLACAYGQKHEHEAPERGSDQDQELRRRARNAASEAIRLSSSTQAVLARLYEGTDPSEDDLHTFKPDPELEKLVKGS